MQFKKLAAIAGSAIMTGLAIAGPALATQVTQLGKISDMVSVTDSTVSFPIFVIGAAAATADVSGAVDMAVNLASNAVVTSSVTGTGAGESVTGGAKIATSGIYLTPFSNPQTIKGIITSSDIPSLLNGGTYSSSSGGSYPYKQYLYLLGQSTNSVPAKITFDRPTTENTPRVSFKTPGSSALWTYKLTFTTPVSLSGVTSTATLQTVIQGTTINFLGKDFVISDCTYSGTTDAGYISDITLLGGKNIVSVETGTPQTVTTDSKDYTVTLSGVAVQTIGGTNYYTAIGDVNGESFSMKAGETKTLSDGTVVAAIKVLQGKTGAADFATIAIGADKVKLASGSRTGADSGTTGTVTKSTSVVSELTSDIVSTGAAGWSVLTLKYVPSSDNWLAVGGSVADPFSSTFNIKFNSIVPDFSDTVNRQTLSWNPSGVNMLLTYKNAVDSEKQLYTLYYNTSSSAWQWGAAALSATGSDNGFRDLVFDEGQNISAVDQDYFVIQKGGFSHVLQYTSYTAATKTHTFTDESGNSLTAISSAGTGAAGDTADLIVDGNTFKVKLVDNSSKVINVDLVGDGNIAGTAAASYTGIGNSLGNETSFLVPKLITSGQGGLYFYRGGGTANLTVVDIWKYPRVGFAGIRLSRSGTTVTVGEYDDATAAWTNQTSTLTVVGNGLYGTQNYTVAKTPGIYIDYQVSCLNTTNVYDCTVSLGTTGGTAYSDRGFILVQEANQGGTTHNWLYLPVSYDTTNSRAYVNTTLYSDDTNYVENSLLGTATEYKGMTTYGTLADHLTSNLGGSATVSYPDVFTFGNVYVLTPTGTVSSGSTGGTTTTQRILPITADVVKLDTDSDIDSAVNGNDVVIVGGPCVNKIAAQVLDKTYPACGASSGIPENAALVQLFADKFATGKTALLVAGWEAANTDLASRIVQQSFPGATTAQKAESSLTITGTVASPSYS
ncbi:hypothetical protein A3K64_02485 [Candidatus Micrarchaeota archaeon RBG_16_36_9]|nr:MAG: hypothetical protein A3K64_02485 [Candidatus Micrarchaeota archaeon RBG_16_36_9]